MEISTEERQAWVQNRTTQELLVQLKETRSTTLEDWSKRSFDGATPDESRMKNDRALGGVSVLDQMISVIENMGEEE